MPYKIAQQKIKNKIFCFLCKYDITHKTVYKTVLFKGKHKKVCTNCSHKTHTPLKDKYKSVDTCCRKCERAVMYKSCIACSICSHFYHGKCIELTITEINQIQTKNDDFYICYRCTEDIFPGNPYDDDNNKISKPTTTPKKCLVCNTNISKNIQYPNKHILYNGFNSSLCFPCSKRGKETPVKDPKLLEFLDCPICLKQVHYESILCDCCQHWVHPSCNNIMNKKLLKELGSSDKPWHCNQCVKLPLLIPQPTKITTKNTDFITHVDCSMCSRKVTGKLTISCSTCNHWVHRKCIGHFDSNADYRKFLNSYSNKDWDCPKCLSEMLPFIMLSDKEFAAEVLEFSSSPTYINKEDFTNLYNTLNDTDFLRKCNDTFLDKENDHTYLNNIDPDVNYLSKDTCNYIIDTENIALSSSKDFTLMTFNIRSIRKNFNSFTYLLSRLKDKLHAICLTETWLGTSDNMLDYELEGYHPPFCQNRADSKHGGGVLTYIHKDIKCAKIDKNLSFKDEFNHCLATEIVLNNSKKTIINLYRSPNNLNTNFLEKFEVIMEKAKNRSCYVMGDTNFNLINIDRHATTEEYFNLMTACSFKPLITKPTRITDNNKTLIDHIWTNDLRTSTSSKSTILITDITDHLPCISSFSNNDLQVKGYRYITNRKIDDKTRSIFRKRIENIKGVLSFHTKNPHTPSPSSRFQDYMDHLTRVYEDCFPLQTKKVHSKVFSKPWITDNILKKINTKNYLYGQKRLKNTPSSRSKYKQAKKEVEELLRNSKNNYLKETLEKAGNNTRQKWAVIRTIINRKKNTGSSCGIPNNILGEHYATIANKLAKNLPQLNSNDIPAGSNAYNKSASSTRNFMLHHLTEREIYESILKLDISKGAGVDGMDIKSLKYVADIIAPHLTSLFNYSIDNGEYPQYLKCAKCVPVFKGAPLDPTTPISYRPISILTSINKVLEQLIHKQITIFIEEHNILPSFQYGYRKMHNTSQAILDLTDSIAKNNKDKLVTISVFMDLSKAFDTVDKNILIKKMKDIGFSDTTMQLINSYMSQRTFCMGNDREEYTTTFGVPQGSILGPLLFIIYTSDMEDITINNKVIVYADDTTLLITGRNLTEAKQHCNAILQRFYNYFTLNKLSINPSKTKYMVFTPKTKLGKKFHDTCNTQVILNNIKLEKVSEIRFLGVIINSKLTWDPHKKHISKKVNKNIGLLYKCRQVMNENSLIKMYKTFIEPYFLYAIEVWGHSAVSETDMINKLQNKVLRVIYNCKRSQDARDENKERIKTIQELYKQVILRLCFKHQVGRLPKYFSDNVLPINNSTALQNRISRTTLSNMYDYKLCFKNDYHTPFKTSCNKVWNSLDIDQKSTPYTHGISRFTAAMKILHH